MKKIRLGLLALALGGFLFQSCGNAENTETTNVDSTTMTSDGLQTADNTEDGISDVPAQPGTEINAQGSGSGNTGNSNTSTGGNGDRDNVNNSGIEQSRRTLPGTDDAPVAVQNRGSKRDPDMAGVKNPPHIDRHLNKDSVNNSSGLAPSR